MKLFMNSNHLQILCFNLQMTLCDYMGKWGYRAVAGQENRSTIFSLQAKVFLVKVPRQCHHAFKTCHLWRTFSIIPDVLRGFKWLSALSLGLLSEAIEKEYWIIYILKLEIKSFYYILITALIPLIFFARTSLRQHLVKVDARTLGSIL